MGLALRALLAAVVLACASPQPSRTALPSLGRADSDRMAGYESPPVLRASELLPAALLRGPQHRVDEEVPTDGLVRHYRIALATGALSPRARAAFEARGIEVLEHAFDALRSQAESARSAR